MLRIYADRFVALSSMLAQVAAVSELTKDGKLPPFQDNHSAPQMVTRMRSHCSAMGLDLSVQQLDRISTKLLTSGTLTVQEFGRLLKEFASRLGDELQSRLVVIIPRNKADYYEDVMPFGDDVLNRFPLANFDIEEAGKCFALGRHTACVMHLQRVLEVGLKGYGKYLGIASLSGTDQPSWNKVLDQTRNEIKERNDKKITTKNWKTKKEAEFCEGIQPFLEAVKTAWRNRSMHADRVYTEEVAKEIFDAIKAFMRHLAEYLDEKGRYHKTKKA